ncbi:MAG TPA: prepilin-type N-terminal cleavage/methylation domain-containing protein [Candidatus Margulisiibacteriota bacterium]|nr:prepilin-type N-terminal cleavage/methylation domain-containing protein [Candidatus Margulisiibacteriota bacterium]
MRSTPTLLGEQGFSLVEMLVATAIVSTVLAAVGTLFAVSRGFMQDQILLVETQQGLRSTLESMARDLRLGGACLPITGDFVVLDGTDSATTDSITTRTGLVRPNLSCISTTLTAAMSKTTTTLTVGTTDGFSPGMRALIRHAGNGTGESFTILTVTPPNTLTKAGGWAQDYPKDSGVYAADERTYSVDTTTDPLLPMLTVTANGNAPSAFAYGIENLTIKYLLNRNCPPCDIVDAPAPADNQWRMVNEILITATARSRSAARNGQYIRLTGSISAKPRNLLP